MPSTIRFIVLSLAFHLLYTASIFDIYFTSPVVHPTRRFSPLDPFGDRPRPLEPPADRLVLIVGDGLRADTLFKHHSAEFLPAWAAGDLQSDGRLHTATALEPSKNWKQNSPLELNLGHFDAAPYIRDAALRRGAWGISNTRVPTESRPGHVALIAGMYEDVSAVTKGWKLNPVSFDSLFNQSSHTFSFGSPDILPMFAKGATPSKVDMESYSEEAEDFTADATTLDIWVLDRLRLLLNRASTNDTLDAQLRTPGTVFFLHLLGLDTTGHTYKPKSSEYVGNLMIVDAVVKETERLLHQFYGERASQRTAFVFSADHGMSNKGNHGDGEPDNTRTPIVAWGSGVRSPRTRGKDEQRYRKDEVQRDASYYADWGALDDVWRQDIEQADVTPLMAALAGLDMPANSEGRLPLDYMDVDPERAVCALAANALEILEVYRVKHEQRQRRMLFFVPFAPLQGKGDELPGADLVLSIRTAISEAKYAEAGEKTHELIGKGLAGAKYLQTYDWLLLVGIIITGYVGSMAYSAIFLLEQYGSHARGTDRSLSSRAAKVLVLLIAALLILRFILESSPITYFLYTAFATFYWYHVADRYRIFALTWRAAATSMMVNEKGSRVHLTLSLKVAMRMILSLAALELMVIGYTHRIAWSAGFVVMGFVWPSFGILTDMKTRHEPLLILWHVCCGLSSLFTLGGVDKEESIPFLIASGVLFFMTGTLILFKSDTFLNEESGMQKSGSLQTCKILRAQLFVLAISTAVTASSSYNLQQKLGLPRVNQLVAWTVLAFCLTVPFLSGFRSSSAIHSPSHRLTVVVFAFAPVFVLLSLRDEAIFFGCYTFTLLIWAKLEAALYEERLYERHQQDQKRSTKRHLEKEDVRIAICFLFLLHVGFFGTGNIASISSFYLSPVYRLVPIFSPFLMAALLLLKILVPFVVLASVLQMLCLTPPVRSRLLKRRKTGADLAGPPLFGAQSVGGLGMNDAYALVLLACLFTDVLALNFLLTVRTEGSWLEIGRSITHFAMSNLLQVFMLALSTVADFVVGRGLKEGGERAKA